MTFGQRRTRTHLLRAEERIEGRLVADLGEDEGDPRPGREALIVGYAAELVGDLPCR